MKKNLNKNEQVGLAVVVALTAVGAITSIVVAVSNDNASDGASSAITTTTVQAPPDTAETPTTTTTAPAPTTTVANRGLAADGSLITVAPRPKEAEPKQVTIRTPVRCPSGGLPTTGSLPGDSANGGKKWVTVSQLSGSCDLEGSRFSLKGMDTRLVFRSDASNFNAFVIDSKTGIQGTAGFPHAQCTGPCSDSDFLTEPAGQYTLRVQADGGPWQLLIQEYR